MNKRLTSKLDQQHYLVHASEGNQLFLVRVLCATARTIVPELSSFREAPYAAQAVHA